MTDTPPSTEPGHTVDPKKTVLLVMDYQPGILNSIVGADVLLRRMAGAIATVRDHGGQVGYVQVAFDESDYAAIPATNKLFARYAEGGHFHYEAAESAIHEDLAPHPGDITVRKTRVGAFSTTDLDQQLHDRGLTTLILAGISTSGVVLSTVRDAADRDYEVFVLADCSADRDAEVHDMLTQRNFPTQARVITIAELLSLFTRLAFSRSTPQIRPMIHALPNCGSALHALIRTSR